MRIRYTREGGVAYFPGLASPFVVDTADLPEDESETLCRLVDDAGLLSMSETRPQPQGADYFVYTVTVETNAERRTVVLTDPLEDPAKQALIDYLNHLRLDQPPAEPPAKHGHKAGGER